MSPSFPFSRGALAYTWNIVFDERPVLLRVIYLTSRAKGIVSSAAFDREKFLTLALLLALPIGAKEVFALLVAAGEGAVMCVMQRLADPSREVGVGRGDDHRPIGLILDLDNSGQRMFGFDMGLIIMGEAKNLVPMRGDKLSGDHQHPARLAVAYPLTGRAHKVVTVRWDRAPCPPTVVIDRLAFATHRRLTEFALRLVRVVPPHSSRSILLVLGKM